MPSATLVTWAISLTLAAAGFWLAYAGLWRDRSRGRPRCGQCWYDMRGASSLACPECGHTAKTQRGLYKARRHWLIAILGTLLLWASLYTHAVRGRLHHSETWPQALTPTSVIIPLMPYVPDDWYQASHRRLVKRFYGENSAGWPHKPKRSWRPDHWWEDHLLAWVAYRAALQPPTSRTLTYYLDILAHVGSAADSYLLRLAKDSDPKVRSQAVSGLRTVATRSVTASEALFSMRDEADDVFRRSVWEALCKCALLADPRINDERLVEALGDSGHGALALESDAILLEMVRRRTPVLTEALEHLVVRAPPWMWVQNEDLTIITALNRATNHPDPLAVRVANDLPVHGQWGQLPKLDLRVRNVDHRGRTLEFVLPAGINSATTDWRWRLVVRNRKGPSLPDKDTRTLTINSHMEWKQLEPGQDYEATLAIEDYICPLKPGNYLCVVEYCPTLGPDYTQSDDVRWNQHIVFRSEPFELEILPT
ncbi:MAG: hypothetical protein WEC36_14970 [Phycisphaeraceae bacterium]